MRFPVLLLATVLAVSVCRSPVAAQEEEGLWSTSDFFYWVQEVDPARGKLTVLVNDEMPAVGSLIITAHDNVAHVRVRLHLEANEIIISQGGEELFSGTFFYAPSYNDLLVPEEMPVYVFHTESAEKPCRRCHRMDATAKDRQPHKPADSLCFACHHEEIATYPNLHKPTAAWQCLECHQPDFGESDLYPDEPVRYVVAEIAELSSLCYRCHQREQQKFASYDAMHGPVGEGACMFCHNSHGSRRPKLLHEKPTTLCVDCHDLAEMLERPVVHPVLLQKGCTACHDPHGSNHSLQLKDALVPLCFSCHPQIKELENNHPVNGHPSHGRPDPRDRQNTITCISCHDPHGSEADRLLPDEEMMMVCIRCHSMGKSQ